MRHGLLLSSLLLSVASAHAGVIIQGTRLIYQAEKNNASIGLNNPDNINYLIQSWVDNIDNSNTKAPFIITPPLFRLDAKQNNMLRVVRTTGNMPQDRESLYWMNIKAIPSSSPKATSNALQIAVKTRIKLIYRPAGIKIHPDEVGNTLSWHRQGNILIVNNPTPFYMNFQKIVINGKPLTNVTWAAPKSESRLTLPDATGSSVSWSVISDYGNISKTWTASLN